MRYSIVSLFAAGAVAQITLPPLHNLAAIQDSNDCGTIVPVVSKCVSQFGGTDGLATANPQALMGCACCENGAPISNAYKGCSNDLTATSKSAADVYGTLYSLCGNAACSATGTATGGGSQSASITAAPSSSAAATSVSGPGNSDDCFSMGDMFSQCMSQTKGFSDLPFASQAPCYCCTLSRGATVWTDQLDSYARTCAAWATTGEPKTIYPAASRFANFCNKFTDACATVATATGSSASDSSSPSETDASATQESTSNANAVTVTATAGPATTTADSGGAGVQLRVGAISGLVVISAALFLA